MGAANLNMRNLANAGFERMTLEGGAAACQLDFGGILERDASVRITTRRIGRRSPRTRNHCCEGRGGNGDGWL